MERYNRSRNFKNISIPLMHLNKKKEKKNKVSVYNKPGEL
jgi:hypothetical protein